jgi:hypothetical protein
MHAANFARFAPENKAPDIALRQHSSLAGSTFFAHKLSPTYYAARRSVGEMPGRMLASTRVSAAAFVALS